MGPGIGQDPRHVDHSQPEPEGNPRAASKQFCAGARGSQGLPDAPDRRARDADRQRCQLRAAQGRVRDHHGPIGFWEYRAAVRRRRIGFIFQFFNLLPDLTVEENVTLPLRILGQNPKKHRDRVDSLFSLLGVSKLRDRLPSGLSGGEMQRVSIARALVTQPELVLADEPTGNLSSKAGEEVIGLLRDVCSRLHATILLVTHNPRDAAAGDRVLFLHDGALLPQSEMKGGPFDVADVFHRLQELGV